MPIPESIAKHELWDASRPYFEAFQDLNMARPMSVGLGGVVPQGILYSEISAYAKDHGFAGSPYEFDLFVRLVRALDEEFLLAAAASKQG